ncbi:hypothetical protein XapA_23020 (plasmid) [Xanthomonas citri pv. punicae]|uniref:hypothetical protein n=1 Tax=Xanthomonas citri TaxID=346 RepID=UPI001583F385|nr:hypothetical protein [Xanthomonas citri]QCZ79536.1 hypothetical protein XapA_23020 [Xanthomonas citri pv. punicae]
MSNIATLLNLQAKAAAAVEEATVLREAVDLFAGWRGLAYRCTISDSAYQTDKRWKERASAHRSMLALLFGSPVLWWAVRGGCKACRLSLFSYPVLIAAYRPPPSCEYTRSCKKVDSAPDVPKQRGSLLV